MTAPDLELFLTSLEAQLSRLRGRAVTLSPRDFALARGWYEAGISAERVGDALERAQAEGQGPTSLAYVRRQVEARPGRLGSRRRESPDAEPPESTAPPLAALHAALDALPESARPAFSDVRIALAALDPNPAPDVLARLDRALDAAALAAVPEPELSRWRAQAARARKRQPSLSPEALHEAEHRTLVRKAREFWGLRGV